MVVDGLHTSNNALAFDLGSISSKAGVPVLA